MRENGKKDFDGWIKVKEKIHFAVRRACKFSVGEIWWCRVGENVGREICGKGKDFLRPVLVVHKLSKDNFIGVPLTSKRHIGTWYVEFIYDKKNEYAVVAQIENISVKRLFYKMGEIPSNDLNKIIVAICELLFSQIKITPSNKTRVAGNPENAMQH